MIDNIKLYNRYWKSIRRQQSGGCVNSDLGPSRCEHNGQHIQENEMGGNTIFYNFLTTRVEYDGWSSHSRFPRTRFVVGRPHAPSGSAGH